MIDFSEQQTLDCAFKYQDYGSHNEGCNGGWTTAFYEYYQEYKIDTENDYPYTSGVTGKPLTQSEATCLHEKGKGVIKVSQYYSVNQYYYTKNEYDPNANEEVLKSWVAQQPIVLYLDSSCDYFWLYSHGIINKDCKNKILDLDHAVVAVGYGTMDGTKYWLLRNSWSEDWGDKGYVYVERKDRFDSYGLFGMAIIFMYPTLV